MSEQMPPMPPPSPSEYGAGPQEPAGPPPKEINWATNGLFALVGLSVIGLILTLAQGDAIRDAIVESDPGLTESEIDAAVDVGRFLAVLIYLIFAALYIWLAIKIRQARNWARITVTVLLLLGLLGGLSSLAQPNPASLKLMSVITAIIALAIVVLLWLRPSSDYFAGRTAAPPQG